MVPRHIQQRSIGRSIHKMQFAVILAPTKLENGPSETVEKDILPADCVAQFAK